MVVVGKSKLSYLRISGWNGSVQRAVKVKQVLYRGLWDEQQACVGIEIDAVGWAVSFHTTTTLD